MSTMTQIVDQVLSEVYGYTATVDSSTYLSVGIDADDLTIYVGDAGLFSRGVIQIDNELMIADAVDRSSNTITIANVSARGVRGTTAASHLAGAIVTMSPSIPRQNVVSAVEQTIQSSNGLFAVGTTSFTYEATVYGYDLPAEADTILDVSWLPSGSENANIPIGRWSHDKYQGQIIIGSAIQPGRTVYVAYAKEPTVPTSAQNFSVTGLPASCEDVIRFGAAWRVISFLEPQSIHAQSAESDASDKQVTPATRLRVAQYLYQMYRQRLEEEVGSLQSKYPIRSHYGG